MNKPVVILTNQRDLAADAVINQIQRGGVPVIRLNIEQAATNPVWGWRPQSSISIIPGAVWWRQFELSRGESQNIVELDELLVVRSQWRAWASCLSDPVVPWMNDLWAARRAENKVEQLRQAHRVGFSIPQTLVTNSLVEAGRLGDPDTLVVKSLAPAYFELTDEAFVYTSSFDQEVINDAIRWNAQPLIVQKMMEGLDVRVIMVGLRAFGACCKTNLTDWRLAPSSAEWKIWEVPTEIFGRCQAYMRNLDLRYAAFDFIDDGENIWFLEANQAGEWTFIDRPLSLGVTEAIASSLIDMATR